MRRLIFGAGVLGSFYVVRLLACGHQVTVLAGGRRAAQLRADGLVVQEYGRSCLRARISVIETLEPEAPDDPVLVLVRNDQVESVSPSLAANKAAPKLVFTFNCLDGPERWMGVPGCERGDRVAGARVPHPVRAGHLESLNPLRSRQSPTGA